MRIYAPTNAWAGLPVAVISELADNAGPSVTNEIEQIAAEVVTRYLPEQDGLEPPAVFVEHHPDGQCRRDALAAEHFDLVTFADHTTRPRFWNVQRGMVQRFGEPEWHRIDRAQVEAGARLYLYGRPRLKRDDSRQPTCRNARCTPP